MPSLPSAYDDMVSAMDSSYAPTGLSGTTSGNPGIPSDDFSFGQVLGNLWGAVKPLAIQGAQTYGAVQVAKYNAQAQAELNRLHSINPSIGPNDPNAAQQTANKTLAQKFLPTDQTGAVDYSKIVIFLVGLLGVLLVVRLIRRK